MLPKFSPRVPTVSKEAAVIGASGQKLKVLTALGESIESLSCCHRDESYSRIRLKANISRALEEGIESA